MKYGVSIAALSAIIMLFLKLIQATPEKQLVRAEQGPLIVGENVLVSGDQPARPHLEPYIAADPKDPKHLVASSIAYTRRDGRGTCAVFSSLDGGRTWARGKLPALDKLDLSLGADAWVAFASGGTVFFSCLLDIFKPAPQEGSTNHVYLFRSTDGGRSWPEPVIMPRGEGRVAFDCPSIFADTSKSKFGGSIYVYSGGAKYSSTGHLISPSMLWRSTDGGTTFSGPINFLPSNLNMDAINVVVLSDGTLVLPFYDNATEAQRFLKQARLWVVTSVDGGQTFSAPKFVAEVSTDNLSVYRDIKLAVDQSPTASRDRLYMVWNDVQAGAANIYLSYSADKGESWSEPVQVNDSANKRVEHWIPAIAVNSDGVVGVSWFARHGESNKKCSEVYFTASLDRGKTFLPSVRVSTVQSCPDVPGNSLRSLPEADSSTIAQRFPVGGDYSGLAAGADGIFHLLWSDSRTGVFQNWTATVRVKQKDARQ